MFQAGTEITLECSVDYLIYDTLVWWEFQSSLQGSIICWVNNTLQGIVCDSTKYPRYYIDSDITDRQFNLIIADSVLADGGMYKCGLVQTTDEQATAIVTIFGRSAVFLMQSNTKLSTSTVENDGER